MPSPPSKFLLVTWWQAAGSLAVLHTDLAPANFLALGLAFFQGVRWGCWGKLQVRSHSCQPEAILICKKVASSLTSLAFKERCSSEILQAAAGWHEGLAASLVPSACVLPGQQERIRAQTSADNPLPIQWHAEVWAWFTFSLKIIPGGRNYNLLRKGGAGDVRGVHATINHFSLRADANPSSKFYQSLKKKKKTWTIRKKSGPASPQAIICGGLRDPVSYCRPVCTGLSELRSSPDGRGLRDGGRAGAHHQERVPDPEAPPGPRTRRDRLVLAVHGHGLRGGLAHGAAADVRADLLLRERRHRQRRGARQPVGPVVPPGVLAHLVDVAVGEGQRAEHGEAGARQALGGKAAAWRAGCGSGLPDTAHLRAHGLASGGSGQSLLLWRREHGVPLTTWAASAVSGQPAFPRPLVTLSGAKQ